MKKTQRKQRGREADGPAFPHDQVEALLVQGEIGNAKDGVIINVYPSHREIARRFGVSHTLISRYAKDHNCKERRATASAQVNAQLDTMRADSRARDIAVTSEAVLDFLDSYFVAFVESFKAGKVRNDSVTDLNTILRLKEHLARNKADKAADLGGLPTLKELQDRHAQMLEDQRLWDEAGKDESDQTVGDQDAD